MEALNFGDEHIAIITAGLAASIRKKYPVIDGLLRVTLLIFTISIIACLVRYMGGGETAVFTVGALAPVLVRSLWISVLALAGVNVLSYILDKKNGTKNVGDNNKAGI